MFARNETNLWNAIDEVDFIQARQLFAIFIENALNVLSQYDFELFYGELKPGAHLISTPFLWI